MSFVDGFILLLILGVLTVGVALMSDDDDWPDGMA